MSASIQKLQGKHILIVEDDAPLLRLLARRFTGYGIRVSQASSGTKALSEIEQHTPDIILLDVELLDMNGLDFATLVRQHDHHKHCSNLIHERWRRSRGRLLENTACRLHLETLRPF